MDLTTNSLLLTWTVFTPFLGLTAILALLALRPALRLSQKAVDEASRGIGMIAAVVATALSIALWVDFDAGTSNLQFIHRFVWMKAWNIEFFLGVDGLSLSMVILTAVVFLVGAIASLPWLGKLDSHHPHFSGKRVPGYWILLLLLETGVFGTFASQDFFLFYVFWEVMLLPMYFLIGIWGAPSRKDPDGRTRGGPYAAIKFFLYTLAGSVLMLLALIAIYYASAPAMLADGTQGPHTFNLVHLTAQAKAGVFTGAKAILGVPFVHLVFVGLFLGFAIKVPMFPFHTWLPDAHVDAPTPISVILAGILLKTGMYGMFRFNMQIFPESLAWASWAIGIIAVINIVYGAFVCMAQKDLKKLIAYSSVSHMGFCLLGLAAMTSTAVNGAVFQMVGHGIVSPMLFLLAGVVYDRAHTRDIEGFGGLAQRMPEYTALTGFAFMASLGLPGLAGFVGEVLVFLGAFAAHDGIFRVLVAISALSVIITAGYYLWTMQRMFLGPFNHRWEHLSDMNWRERITLYPLAVATVLLGVWPAPVLDMVRETVNTLMAGM